MITVELGHEPPDGKGGFKFARSVIGLLSLGARIIDKEERENNGDPMKYTR